MNVGALLGYYFIWHYTRAITDILNIVRNFLWFFGHFFSFGELTRTLFSPLKRLHEDYKFDPDNLFENIIGSLIVNVMMRAVAFVMRVTVMAVGLLVILTTLIFAVLFLTVWLFLPLLIVSALSFSIPVLFF
jgi:hypothetical protein